MPVHEARHHQLVRQALGLHRRALAVRAAHRRFRQRIAMQRRTAALQHRRQRAADDQVRIAPDRRGEVAVVLHRQSVMAQRTDVVARLLHAAQRQRADHAELWRLPRALEHRADLARLRVVAQAARVHPDAVQKVLERIELLRVRLLVHAVEQRHAARLSEFRHSLVRRKHEVLDHQLGLAPRPFGDLHRLARLIQDELRLVRVKVDRALRLPLVADAPRQLTHGQQRFLKLSHPLPLRRIAVKEPVHVVIHQPRLGARDRAQQARVHHAARFIHVHQRAHGELVLVRAQ